MNPEHLRAMASLFAAVNKPSASPKPSYESFTHAIVWDDELPELSASIPNWDSFRAVLRHRTCLILGQRSKYSRYWDDAKESFPDWVGFTANRSTSSPELEQLFNEGAASTLQFVRENIRKM